MLYFVLKLTYGLQCDKGTTMHVTLDAIQNRITQLKDHQDQTSSEIISLMIIKSLLVAILIIRDFRNIQVSKNLIFEYFQVKRFILLNIETHSFLYVYINGNERSIQI